MRNYEKKIINVGKFRIATGDTLNITDPCYDNDVWCRANVKSEEIETGLFSAYAIEYDCGDWGKRIGQLIIVNEKYISLDSAILDIEFKEYIDEVGVDAGLCGFFINKPNYDYDNEWLPLCKYLHKDGYDVDNWMARKDNPFKCEGVCSSSGYGDGCYQVFSASKDNLKYAFKIVFIEENED